MLVYRKAGSGTQPFRAADGHAALLHALAAARRIFRGRGGPFSPARKILRDPLLLSDMEKPIPPARGAGKGGSALRLRRLRRGRAARRGHPFLHLKSLGADVRTYLPDRYRGLRPQRGGRARQEVKDTGLLLTGRSGVNAVDTAALAKELGMDIDHHHRRTRRTARWSTRF